MGIPIQNTDWWKSLPADLRWRVSSGTAAFMLSNFLHGEQGALMVAAEMVNAVPHMDAKFYAATQTLDEARHVEAFAAYIKQLGEVHPIMPSLKTLLDETLGRESWMHKAVGMQIVVEGLALYMFRDMRNATRDPLLKQLLTYVSRDEARHTGYGIKYLNHVVHTLSDVEKTELEDFGFEATRLLVDSRRGQTMRESAMKIWSKAGLEPQELFEAIGNEREKLGPAMQAGGGAFGPVRGFIIPTMKSIGLFSDRLEGHFREMFAHTFDEERAKAMVFGDVLPDDLDEWLEQGAD
jgi:rubrerythrin